MSAGSGTRTGLRMPPILQVAGGAEGFWSRVDRGADDACWPWTGARNSKGYGSVRVGRKMVGAHRIALASTGVDIDGLCALHRCDNPPCCNPAHLFKGTHGDNNRDTASKGRTRSGDQHPGAKLTNRHVREIRSRLAAGEQGLALAADYGVTPQTISLIRNRRIWRNA